MAHRRPLGSLINHPNLIRHYIVIYIVALAVLSGCSGPRLGGVVERTAFSGEDKRAVGLSYARSMRLSVPGPAGRLRPTALIALSNEEFVAVDRDRGLAALFSSQGWFITYLEAPGSFSPGAAAEGPGMSIYLMDSMSSLVYRFDARGQLSGKMLAGESIQRPADLCIDKLETAYISDPENEEILVTDAGLGSTRRIGGYGTGEGMLIDPSGIAVDERNRLYVCDSGNSRLQVFDQWGAVLRVCPLAGGAYAPRPEDVAVDRWGNAFVTDSGCRCLRVLDSAGQETFRLEGSGPGLAFTGTPGGLDESDGKIYVADAVDGAIQVFDIIYER